MWYDWQQIIYSRFTEKICVSLLFPHPQLSLTHAHRHTPRTLHEREETNHFLHVGRHGVDPAAQSIVQRDNLKMLLHPEPWNKRKARNYAGTSFHGNGMQVPLRGVREYMSRILFYTVHSLTTYWWTFKSQISTTGLCKWWQCFRSR